jgi:hypothetical protein
MYYRLRIVLLKHGKMMEAPLQLLALDSLTE